MILCFAAILIGGWCSHKEWHVGTIICAGLVLYGCQQAVH